MAAIDELLEQITDDNLRTRLCKEIARLKDNTQFGLVWEKHLPENAQLPGFKMREGSTVAVRGESTKDSKTMTVLSIDKEKGMALCGFETKDAKGKVVAKRQSFPIDDLVVVARCGEPIFPTLRPVDKIEKAPNSYLWHSLIQADNYHALQLLAYLYPGQVDCIYIDPPYNTGAKDWKYNNDYVDSNDKYRHSKWLSMMESRLMLAKKLLNPNDSVLIVTIDEKEYLHLGCLLEQMFPEARIQMISSVINPKGNRRDNEFSRCEEYIFFIYLGDACLQSNGRDMLRETDSDYNYDEDKSVRLRALLRGASNHGKRTDRPNLFYPIFFEKETGQFIGPGRVLNIDENRDDYQVPEGAMAMWPLGSNNIELTWNLQPSTLVKKHKKHFLRFGKWDGKKRTGYYFSESQEKNFYEGRYNILGQDQDGAYVIEHKDAANKDIRPLTIWNTKSHSASEYGTTLLNSILLDRRFSFPKSLYAVHDTIRFFVADKPNALIVDFFAGSGTTLHAVNMLNAEDGGQRRCIMVTNNEVGETDAKEMSKRGFKPGDEEWESRGIAQYVTWPRTVCSIKGVDVNGQPIKGNYLGNDRPMSDGFEANCEFFRLDFLDKNEVAFGRAFREILPLLWLKAGAKGERPEIPANSDIPEMLVLPKNNFAVLTDEDYFPDFRQLVAGNREIEHVFIVTDSNKGFQEMALELPGHTTYQLYRDYLDNFRINLNDTTSR